MKTYLIKELANKLWEAGLIPPLRDQAVIRVLGDAMKDQDVIIWSVQDVIDRAKERGIPLAVEDAREILDITIHKHNCNEGVNWTVIDLHTDWHVAKQRNPFI